MDKKKEIKEVTRYISEPVANMLWGRSAGRCQFSGHNIELYKSPVTQETVNIAQKAHIYSFSEKGPRGWGPFIFNKSEINNIDNLMLMCHGCHQLIDDDEEGKQYSAVQLIKWKQEHEERVRIATEIVPDKKSNVVFYGSNIGEQKSVFNKSEAFPTIFPNRYPVSEHPIILSMKWNGKDKDSTFWKVEEENLVNEFNEKIKPILERNENTHFSLFALADMPLLIKLGSLFVDIPHVDVYQLIRNPKGWKWQDYPDGFEFIVNEPKDKSKTPVLVFSLSTDKVAEERITSVLGEDINIWEVTASDNHRFNDSIRHPAQLVIFIQTVRKLLEKILSQYDSKTHLHVFPVMSVSCCVEFGRLRMPKVDMPWIIYDQNYEEKKFIKALTIGG